MLIKCCFYFSERVSKMRNVLMYLLLVAVLATVAQAASVTLSTGLEADFDLLSGGPLFYGTYDIYSFGQTNDSSIAQTFTVGPDAWSITSINLIYETDNNTGPATVVLSVFEVADPIATNMTVPGTTLLTQTLVVPDVAAVDTLLTLTLDAPLPLSANTSYAVRFDCSDISATNNFEWFRTGSGGGNPLVDGASYRGDETDNTRDAALALTGTVVYSLSVDIAADSAYATAGVPLQLEADVIDSVPGPSALTYAWTATGPGAATFSDAAIEDPTVTVTVPGIYTLQLEATDGENVRSDTMQVYLLPDSALLGHWDFEGLPDPNTLTDVTGNGFTGVWASTDGGDPNVTTGILDSGTSQAWDASFSDGYWEVPNAITGGGDPNFNECLFGITFATWIKMSSNLTVGSSFPMVACFGDANSRLEIRRDDGMLPSVSGAGGNARGRRLDDDLWHHVVGVVDGQNGLVSMYIDGVEDANSVIPAGSLVEVVEPLRIGNRVATRLFSGEMDDLRIYNYPLTAAEIAALAAAGDVPVYANAGEDQLVNFKNQPVQLAGELVVDDGIPAAATLSWELTAYVAGADPNFITINNPTAADATVTYPAVPVEGIYQFTLTATDTVTTSADSVLITVRIPECADVVADGLNSSMDFNDDCKVDLQDFAAFALEWLNCTDPKGGAGCIAPY
jgi:hypothetical protein